MHDFHHKARSFWRMALFSAPLYLLLMFIARGQGWGAPALAWDLGQLRAEGGLIWWGGVWSGVLCLTAYLRYKRREPPFSPKRWWVCYIAALAVLDGLQLAAFAAWWFTGRGEPFLLSAGLAYVCLAVLHPRENEVSPGKDAENLKPPDPTGEPH